MSACTTRQTVLAPARGQLAKILFKLQPAPSTQQTPMAATHGARHSAACSSPPRHKARCAWACRSMHCAICSRSCGPRRRRIQQRLALCTAATCFAANPPACWSWRSWTPGKAPWRGSKHPVQVNRRPCSRACQWANRCGARLRRPSSHERRTAADHSSPGRPAH